MDFFTKDQIEKLGNAIIYLSSKIKPLPKTKLLKLIFIIEEFSIKKFGIPFFNLKFQVWKLGPVQRDLFIEFSNSSDLLKEFIDIQYIGDSCSIIAKKEFSDDEFNDLEISLLDLIIEKFGPLSANELIDYTHKPGSLWHNTAQRYGLLESFEAGSSNSTNIEINLSELIQDSENLKSFYNDYKSFVEFGKPLKANV